MTTFSSDQAKIEAIQTALPTQCPYCECSEYSDDVSDLFVNVTRSFACGIYLPALDDHLPNASQAVWRAHAERSR